MKRIIGSFGIVLLVVACNPKVGEVVVEDKTSEAAAPYAAGKTLYESKCIKCHGLKPVNDFSKEQWDKILPAMMDKAKLTSEEKVQVNDYVYWKIAN